MTNQANRGLLLNYSCQNLKARKNCLKNKTKLFMLTTLPRYDYGIRFISTADGMGDVIDAY